MKVIVDIPEVPKNDKQRWTLANGTPYEERPHGECNQCRHYDGVHGVKGHAPCLHWNIGGVMWNDYCSRFEKEGEAE